MAFRDFKPSDAKTIVKWFKDEREFRMWGGDNFDTYPPSPEDVIKYHEKVSKEYDVHPLVFKRWGRLLGYLVLATIYSKPQFGCFCVIIVNKRKRNKGYGKKMITEAIKYCNQRFKTESFTLVVYNSNKIAIKCYKDIGFKEARVDEDKITYRFHGEEWYDIVMLDEV